MSLPTDFREAQWEKGFVFKHFFLLDSSDEV